MVEDDLLSPPGGAIDEILGVRQNIQAAARARDAGQIPTAETPVHKRSVRRRTFHSIERTQNAIARFATLPKPGETWHCLMDGSFDGYDLIDVLLTRAGRIAELHLATVGFNRTNANRLLAQLDSGEIRRATLLTSLFFETDKNEQDTADRLARELNTRPGCSYASTRSHAKIIAALHRDGRAFVIESSANLRSCKSAEQFTLCQDRPLFDWYAGWLRAAHDNDQSRHTSRGRQNRPAAR